MENCINLIKSVYHIQVLYCTIQIEVLWKPPAGPGRSDSCRPVDVFAPPPLPVQVINVTDSETVSITRVSIEAQDVTFSAR